MSLREHEDYYIRADGRLVFTAGYLLRRGYCCGNGCQNCPYAFINVPEPKRSHLLSLRDDEQPGRQA